MNTAARTEVMAMIGPVTSSMARRAACRGGSPFSMWRSTFSTTTIASSTTMPIDSTNPNNDRVLSEKPIRYMTANVPTSDTGTAIRGISEARQLRRNSTTTTTTRRIASSKVVATVCNEARTNTVGS
ncbi:hypothetical protein D3C81_1195370 [compost metagenome]